MILLGIESSCDETAAAIVRSSDDGSCVQLISHSIATSLSQHAQTGGIIPEMAAREQIKCIIPVIYDALEKAGAPNIDAIAVTYGPGLIGSLLVGVETAKTLSYIWNKPLIPVNHLYGHIYANWIKLPSPHTLSLNTGRGTKGEGFPQFPLAALVVSGGHTDLVLMKSHKDITWLGGTRDDAAGECFDKCARLLGYMYPGGPKISQLAQKGDPKKFAFPRPMIGSHDFHFSFSGLKTAFLNVTAKNFPILRTSQEKIGWQQVALEEHLNNTEKQVLYDLCASLQQAIVDILVKKTIAAAEKFQVKSILLSGGVAANETLGDLLQQSAISHKLSAKIFVPQKSLCTDNAAMIGSAGFFQQKFTDWRTLTANPQLYFD